MTSLLLPALRGEIDEVLDAEGAVSIQLLHRYLERSMPPEQQPGLVGDTAGRSCILASYSQRAEELRKRGYRPIVNERPNDYIPFPRNQLFQPRPGEFEHLETLLFGADKDRQPVRLGLVGVVGLGGVGKTQLAVEFAYRCLDQQRFPSGVFWMPATGTTSYSWHSYLAELSLKSNYLPPDDDPSSSENELQRACHFCRYLADHRDALLILDNVEDPNLVVYALPALAGKDIACTLLYTSRSRLTPPGIMTHPVEQLPPEAAWRLLLATTRPSLLDEVLAGSQVPEAEAARHLCQSVGYLPLALVHLRGLLARDSRLTVARLAEVLKQRGALELAKTQQGDAAPLFATFSLSWEKVRDEATRRLFKLASYFPEATPIPLWLLGLGESGESLTPLGEACMQLQELSLLEELSGEQVRLHPLVREFGRQLVAEDGERGTVLLQDAGERLLAEFADLSRLEARARPGGYRSCLEQVQAVRAYLGELGRADSAQQIQHIERWMDRESYLLANEHWWPNTLPGLFYQQLHNRSVEEAHRLPSGKTPGRWIKLTEPAGAEDRSLVRIFAGHTALVTSVAFSPDGKYVLTGSGDQTARLWERESGQLLTSYQGHTSRVTSVAFSPDGRLVITCDVHGRVFLWRGKGLDRGQLLGIYVATYEIGAIYWQDATHVILVDTGGPQFRPHFYRLRLEGKW